MGWNTIWTQSTCPFYHGTSRLTAKLHPYLGNIPFRGTKCFSSSCIMGMEYPARFCASKHQDILKIRLNRYLLNKPVDTIIGCLTVGESTCSKMVLRKLLVLPRPLHITEATERDSLNMHDYASWSIVEPNVYVTCGSRQWPALALKPLIALECIGWRRRRLFRTMAKLWFTFSNLRF